MKTCLSGRSINEDFFRWARPHKGFRSPPTGQEGVQFVHRNRKPAENEVQWGKDHLWMAIFILTATHMSREVLV